MGIPYDNRTTPNESAPDRRYKTECILRKWRQPVRTRSIAITETSKPWRPGWTVMGSCHSQKKFAVSPLQNSIVSQIFIFLLLLSTANSAKSSKKRQRCDVDRCSKYFHSLLDMTNDIDKCHQLSSHRDCLTSMDDVCRGNLLFHTSIHVNEKRLKKLNCLVILREKPAEDGSSGNSERTNQCIYAGKPKFKLCSLFGDPHVRTFSDKCHTCKANGSWPLINNDYLVVKATNSIVKGQLQATVISKLVVTIQGSGECAEERTYLAEIGNDLSSTFTDGTTHTGLEKSVNVSVKEPGKEIQIDIRFIGTTILIRNVGSHLTFSIQMPEEIVDSPVDRRRQMCVRGCPKHQRIRLKKEISRLDVKDPEEFTKIYSEQEARRRCRNVLLGLDEDLLEREKRSVGKKGRNEHHRRDAEVDASVKSWWQLSPDRGESSKPPSRSKKNRNRHKISAQGRKHLEEFSFLKDDPAPGSRGRERGAVSSVGRGTNFYFEACVFDLMTTGDITYASSARGAFDDVTRFHRSGKRAKGASRKAINDYPIVSTTSPPKKTTTNTPPIRVTATKRSRGMPTTSGSHPLSANLTLLIFSVLLSTYIFNLIHFQIFFNICNSFSNRKLRTT